MSVALAIVFSVAGIVYARGRMRRSKGAGGNGGGFFHLDGKESLLSSGGAVGEKAD
jgi:hypothetical protein